MIGLRPNTTTPHYQAPTNTMSQFDVLKTIHDASITSADDETVPTGVVQSSTRLQLMVSNLSTNNTPEGLLHAVREVIAALKNKLPSIKIAKWSDNILIGKKVVLVDQIPSEVEKAELFLHNFSRFSNGKKGYFRLQVIHTTDVSPTLLVETAKSFNVPQQQGVYAAASPAINPQTIGMLIGSSETMLETKDLYYLLTRLSKVSVIGYTWKYINTGEKGKFNNAQKAVYVETESASAKKLTTFFQSYFNEEQNDLFGAPITFLPTNTYPTPTQAMKIKKYAPLQTKLMSDMHESEVELSNFITIQYRKEGKKVSSCLLEALLQVKSITPKTVIHNNKQSEFFGKLFYAAVTNAETNLTTFQFPAYNEREANSILRALPLFIRDFFQLNIEEKQYCRSQHLANALNGEWNCEQRSFLSPQDLKEKVQFENLQLVTQATNQNTFISPDHQRAMMGEGPNDEDTNATNLHNNAAPVDDDSTLTNDTGSTRTSKAKAIADKQVKAIAKQYLLKQTEDKEKMDKQQEQLEQQKKEMIEMQRMLNKIMEKSKSPHRVTRSATKTTPPKQKQIPALPDSPTTSEEFMQEPVDIVDGEEEEEDRTVDYFFDDELDSDESDHPTTEHHRNAPSKVKTRPVSPGKRKNNKRQSQSPSKRATTRGTGGSPRC